MKTKVIYTILIATILGLCTYIYLDNKKKEPKDDTSNSNITSNSNSNIDITSNIESNTTSNEIISNSNSNDISNNNESNSTSNNSSNAISNSNIISNSNKVSNTTSNKISNNTSNKTSNVTSNKTSNSNTQTGMNTNGVFTGLYQKDNITLKIYQINNKIHYMIYNNSRVFQKSTCKISGTKATCAGNNNTITLNNASVTYSKINDSFTGETINKVKNYTIENYYTDFMLGNTSYLNTNNGIYVNNNDSIKLYQLNSNQIFAIINVTKKKDGVRDNTIPNTFYKEIELTKSGNKLVGETAYGQIEITLGTQNITVKSKSTNIADILYHLTTENNTKEYKSVEYTYKGKYTLSNIVSEHFPD